MKLHLIRTSCHVRQTHLAIRKPLYAPLSEHLSPYLKPHFIWTCLTAIVATLLVSYQGIHTIQHFPWWGLGCQWFYDHCSGIRSVYRYTTVCNNTSRETLPATDISAVSDCDDSSGNCWMDVITHANSCLLTSPSRTWRQHRFWGPSLTTLPVLHRCISMTPCETRPPSN